jgi:hypothetical protein
MNIDNNHFNPPKKSTNTYLKSKDILKSTIKQQTENANNNKPLNNSNSSIYVKNKDIAKHSKKQDHIHNNYISNVKSKYDFVGSDNKASKNMTSNMKKESLSKYRPQIGGINTDRIYLDKNNVNLKKSIEFEYFGHPSVKLDKLVNINDTKKNSNETETKKINTLNSRNIDKIFIETLKDNPYAIKYYYD